MKMWKLRGEQDKQEEDKSKKGQREEKWITDKLKEVNGKS